MNLKITYLSSRRLVGTIGTASSCMSSVALGVVAIFLIPASSVVPQLLLLVLACLSFVTTLLRPFIRGGRGEKEASIFKSKAPVDYELMEFRRYSADVSDIGKSATWVEPLHQLIDEMKVARHTSFALIFLRALWERGLHKAAFVLLDMAAYIVKLGVVRHTFLSQDEKAHTYYREMWYYDIDYTRVPMKRFRYAAMRIIDALGIALEFGFIGRTANIFRSEGECLEYFHDTDDEDEVTSTGTKEF